MARDITQVHPTLQTKIAQLKELCNKNGLTIGISECLRTVEEQNLLYAKGRTTSGSIVTNAKGTSYSSQHQWGIAFDFYRNDGIGAFNDNDGFFSKVTQLAKSIGLAWGGDWTSIKDKPHLYLPDWGSTTSKLKATYGTPDKFIATWGGTSVVTPTPTVTAQVSSSANQNVLDFQRACIADGVTDSNGNKLVADGINGSKTKSAMKKVLLKKGSEGVLVEFVQFRVGAKVDRDFGSKTKVAVIAYQHAHGLIKDGVVGAKTINCMLG